MLTGIPTILAVLTVLMVGFGLSRSSLTNADFWKGASRVGYWVFFPVLLFRTITLMDAPAETIWPFIYILFAGLFLVTIIIWVLCRLAGVSMSAQACVLQGSFRHNGFIALAVIQGLFGESGLVLGAIAMSVLVAPSNVMAVITMALSHPGGAKNGENMGRYILKEIIRNPLIVAIMLALIMRMFSWTIPPVLDEATAMISQSALTFMLLTVGAGLKFQSLAGRIAPLFIAASAKIIIFPVLLMSGGIMMGLPGEAIVVLAIFGAVPTAASSFTLAQEMRGDAPLMADIIMLQTLLSIPGLILWIWIAS